MRTSTTTIHDLPYESFSNDILAFVGSDHYRHVAAVNRKFCDCYPEPTETSYEIAISSVACAQIFITESQEGRAAICGMAAKYGKLNVLQWACEQGCPWNHWTYYQDAKNGHLEVLQWAHE